MLKKLYVDNYKSLVNFEFAPAGIQLILGANGAGKTTAFAAFALLREFLVEGTATGDLFPTRTLTRWDRRDVQTFEVEVAGNGGCYFYKVEIEHARETQQSAVRLEELRYDDRPLFTFVSGEARFTRDDGSVSAAFPLGRKRSGLANVAPRPGNSRLIWFKEWMERATCLRILPDRIATTSQNEVSRLGPDAANFASWFRHLVSEKPGAIHALFESLREIIDGFDELRLTKEGETARTLRVVTSSMADNPAKPSTLEFGFDELSDGQRVLIVLYTLLHCSLAEGATLWIDDPVSHVALPEIQPWLNAVSDRVEEADAQVLLISHHPELVDFFAPDRVIQFRRPGGGPVRVGLLTIDPEAGLSPAEMIARGWDDE